MRERFDGLLSADPSYSAQLAAYVDGELVIDLVGGAGLEQDSLTGVFSVSKGVSALVLGMLVEQGELDLDRRVAAYWPAFAAQGKDRVTVRQMLSHQAGLVGLPGGLSQQDLVESSAAAERLAAARPEWFPGSAFGYHGLTLGTLTEELVRRVAGEPLQALYEREIRSPRGLDFYLGLPAGQEHRYLPVEPAAAEAAALGDDREVPQPVGDSLFDFMNSVEGTSGSLVASAASPNEPAIRAAGPAAVGGVGTARGLAAVFAATVSSLEGRSPLLSPEVVERMAQQQVWGRDRVLDTEMCFAVVFMKPQPRMEFGSHRAFGHDGAGGALGFADPTWRLGFGYIPQPMQPPGGADPKAVELARLLRRCAGAPRV